MNREFALEVADAILKDGEHVQLEESNRIGVDKLMDRGLSGFNMGSFAQTGSDARGHCRTVGCIGGWAAHLGKEGQGVSVSYDGRLNLGLGRKAADELFLMTGIVDDDAPLMEDVTPEQAASCLRILARIEGKVKARHVREAWREALGLV